MLRLLQIAYRPANSKQVRAARRCVIKRLCRAFKFDDHRKLTGLIPKSWVDEYKP